MDSLRDQAWDDFLQGQKFLDLPAAPLSPQLLLPLSLVTVRQFKSKTMVDQDKVPVKDIVERMREPAKRHGNETLIASLTVVRINRPSFRSLDIERRIFVDLFKTLNLDTYWMHMIQRSGSGSFQLKHLVNRGENYIHTFYISTAAYILIWSYTSIDLATKGIIIPQSTVSWDSANIFARFAHEVERHKALISSPQFLAFIGGVVLVQWMDWTTDDKYRLIHKIEVETGYKRQSTGSREQRWRNTEQLVELSTKTIDCLLTFARVIRQIPIARKIIQDLNPESQIPPGITQSSICKIAEAADWLQNDVDTIEHDNTYLQERARTQHTVIFNLLNREDALVNIEIARAAKKDSSAMKTIAIMTMAFLPGTFFASLFAVPNLQWDDKTVTSKNFWIYWAFTLPSTALVFGIWWIFGLKRVADCMPDKGRKGRDTPTTEAPDMESIGYDRKEGRRLGLLWRLPNLRRQRKALGIYEQEMGIMDSH